MQHPISALLLVSICSATSILTESDLSRANQVQPRQLLTGADFASMVTKLNGHLNHVAETKACAEFTDDELKGLVRILMSSKHEELQQIYQSTDNLRALSHDSLEGLEQHWQAQQLVIQEHPDLAEMAKAAKCHQAVMLFAHHLSGDTQAEVARLTQLPQLPSHRFTAPIAEQKSGQQAIDLVHADYVQQSSCAAGHIIADGASKYTPGCLGSSECPMWPPQFSAPFGLYSTFPPIHNATSMFYYKITDGEKKQLVDYQTYCFPFTNLLHYKQPCKLYFQKEGIFLHQPGHVNCCQFNSANVSAVPIQFLHSFTLKESNVKAQDYYGNEVSTDHWEGPLNFQYWTVGHNDTRYKNWGHDIVFQDGPTGVTWQWGNFDVSPQSDSVFELPGTAEECAKSCPKF